MITKTVIAIFGAQSRGKTTTLRVVYDQISKRYQCVHEKDSPVVNENKDVYALFRIKNATIGFESLGDPVDRHAESLQKFLNEKCDIIITACRTSGPTTNAVADFSKQGYQVIWLKDPLYENEQPKRISYNNCHYFANYILDMFEDILIGKL